MGKHSLLATIYINLSDSKLNPLDYIIIISLVNSQYNRRHLVSSDFIAKN